MRQLTALAAVLWAVHLPMPAAVPFMRAAAFDSPDPSAADLVARILQSDPWGLGDAEVVARATIRDGSGRTQVLAFTARSRRYQDHLTKSLVRFTGPRDLAGVGFLQVQKRDADDDRWLYLPELKRSRRIAGSIRHSAFMGTDFSYADLDRRDLRLALPSLKGEQTVGDAACWLVEAIPQGQESTYGRLEIWVRKDNFIPVKWLMYARSGVLLKTLLAGETREIDGRWFIIRSTMTNHADGRETALVLDRISPGSNIRDDEFTLRSLEKM